MYFSIAASIFIKNLNNKPNYMQKRIGSYIIISDMLIVQKIEILLDRIAEPNKLADLPTMIHQ
ncbi:hypothetical protein HZS_3260 [Henneguya salminicola]|nr:hypothetical protein HZS_3260 [Henneguya salminicola]